MYHSSVDGFAWPGKSTTQAQFESPSSWHCPKAEYLMTFVGVGKSYVLHSLPGEVLHHSGVLVVHTEKHSEVQSSLHSGLLVVDAAWSGQLAFAIGPHNTTAVAATSATMFLVFMHFISALFSGFVLVCVSPTIRRL